MRVKRSTFHKVFISLIYLCVWLSLATMLIGCTLLKITTKQSCIGRIRIESTRLGVNSGNGNIAWSHSGEYLAYTHGYSVWIVPVDKWSEASKVYTEGRSDFDSYILESRFVVWSPDDKAVGFTLARFINAWQAEDVMVQLDLQQQTITPIAEENAELIDWSDDNRVLAQRGGVWIFDMPSRVWHPLVDPITGEIAGGFPNWAPNGSITLGAFLDWRWSTGNISIVHWPSNQWETLMIDDQPVQMMCTSAFPCRPVSSPDGTWIAWIEAEMTSENYIWRIMLYARERSEIVQVVSSEDYGFAEAQAPSWSPDSKRLAFSALDGLGGERIIWILDLAVR